MVKTVGDSFLNYVEEGYFTVRWHSGSVMSGGVAKPHEGSKIGNFGQIDVVFNLSDTHSGVIIIVDL
jgi:hypothetical protein